MERYESAKTKAPPGRGRQRRRPILGSRARSLPEVAFGSGASWRSLLSATISRSLRRTDSIVGSSSMIVILPCLNLLSVNVPAWLSSSQPPRRPYSSHTLSPHSHRYKRNLLPVLGSGCGERREEGRCRLGSAASDFGSAARAACRLLPPLILLFTIMAEAGHGPGHSIFSSTQICS